MAQPHDIPLDILDQRDHLATPFLIAVVIHVGLVAALFFGWYWMNRNRGTLGDATPGGGPAYAVSPVHTIPIPQRDAPLNPVAHDTQSMVPTAPAKQDVAKKPPVLDKNAFEIADKKRQAERPSKQQQYTQPTPQNQISSRTSQAVSNPMYAAQNGSGQVGVGPNSPLGTLGLGWYADAIRQRIAQNWNTNGLDSRSQSIPTVVSFWIMRDGTVRNPQIVQSSGNPSIDNTALRAVYQSNPLPALPAQVRDNSITAQFTFNLR
jgi:TonB family protein